MKRFERSKQLYQGVFIAAVLPMNQDESLDLPRIKPCVDYLVNAGMGPGNAIYVSLSAGGEAMMLGKDERKAAAEAAVEAAAGRIPVFVGVSSDCTATTVELAKHADRIGADGLQLEPPWYFAGMADDVFGYYRAVSEAVEIGITAYRSGLVGRGEDDADVLHCRGGRWAGRRAPAGWRGRWRFGSRILTLVHCHPWRVWKQVRLADSVSENPCHQNFHQGADGLNFMSSLDSGSNSSTSFEPSSW
ncbi:MAG: dihydrodipicolinate synthase family protein [Bryobacteraceae bacterium]